MTDEKDIQHPTAMLTADLELLEIEAAEGGSEAEDAPSPLPGLRLIAYTGAPMQVAGWDAPVVIDVKGVKWPKETLPIRLGHMPLRGIGHTTRIVRGDDRIIAEGVVSRDTPEAQEFMASARRGFPWQASVGLDPIKVTFTRKGSKAAVNGRQIDGPAYVVRKGMLREISVVDLGADGNTAARLAAGGQLMADEEREERTEEQPVEEMKAETIQAMREQIAAERERVNAIMGICGGKHPEIEAQAIREGWSPERTELEVLRAERAKPTPASVVSTSSVQVTPEVLEAGLLISAGYDPERLTVEYGEQVIEAAERIWRHGLGLEQAVLEAARAKGYSERSLRFNRDMFRYAFSPSLPGLRAAGNFSTLDISGILSNVANKFLRRGFDAIESAWREISARRSVSDFKAVTWYRLTGDLKYEEVPPSGEIKSGTLGEASGTIQARTYGRLLMISRQDIINDDLDAISRVPQRLGRGAALKLNEVFWTEFLDDSAFFTSGNGNLLTGANSALGIPALTTAETTFVTQTDDDGNPLGVEPRILLVPPAIRALAAKLMASAETRDPSATGEVGTANPFAGRFRVVSSAYLQSSAIPGSSSTAWYLLADPNDIPVIEVAFLNGREAPVIESADADFDVLGIRMRGYHDFGVSKVEFRAGVKSTGQ